MSLVNYRREGSLALLQLNNPPFNAFSEALLDDFARCLALYEQDGEARLAVVHGQGADFSIGALAHELGVVYNSDAARPLVDAVEACAKPLIPDARSRTGGGVGACAGVPLAPGNRDRPYRGPGNPHRPTTGGWRHATLATADRD